MKQTRSLELISSILESNIDSFSELLRLSELDPKSDFVASDMSHVDFGEFDFQRLNLKNANLDGAIYRGEPVIYASAFKDNRQITTASTEDRSKIISSFLESIQWKNEEIRWDVINSEDKECRKRAFIQQVHKSLHSFRDLSIKSAATPTVILRNIYIDNRDRLSVENWLRQVCSLGAFETNPSLRTIIVRSFIVSLGQTYNNCTIGKFTWNGSTHVLPSFFSRIDAHSSDLALNFASFEKFVPQALDINLSGERQDALGDSVYGIIYAFIDLQDRMNFMRFKTISAAKKIPFCGLNIICSTGRTQTKNIGNYDQETEKKIKIYRNMKQFLSDTGIDIANEDLESELDAARNCGGSEEEIRNHFTRHISNLVNYDLLQALKEFL